MDTLQVLNEFATNVATSLDQAKIAPADGALCAVMLIVAREEDEMPIGASLNYVDGKWEVELQTIQSERVVSEPPEGLV